MMGISEHNVNPEAPLSAQSAAAAFDLSPPGVRRRTSKSQWKWWSGLIVLTIGGYWAATRIFATPAPTAATASAQAHRGVPVSVAKTTLGSLNIYLNGLGSVNAFYTVTLKTRVEGELVKVAFEEGQDVKAGQLLAEIDPRPYRVQLEQAEGQLEKDRAALADAQITLARYEKLYAESVIARQELDNQRASMVEDRGAVMADEGAVASARLNLDYCEITAPITGRIGLRLVDPGNMVYPTDTQGLAVITQLQPIAVVFSLPEDNLPQIERAMRRGQLTAEAWDRSFTDQLATGTLLTTNNEIDQSTGTVKLKAVFANPDNLLFPNQFVNVKLLVGTLTDAVLAPMAALQKSSQGSFVYLVKPDDTVTARPVEVAASEGEVSAIASGLKPGDSVVVEGVDKLREGAKVRPRILRSAAQDRIAQ
jgi:multidrug efflux system membrane fusion protein